MTKVGVRSSRYLDSITPENINFAKGKRASQSIRFSPLPIDFETLVHSDSRRVRVVDFCVGMERTYLSDFLFLLNLLQGNDHDLALTF